MRAPSPQISDLHSPNALCQHALGREGLCQNQDSRDSRDFQDFRFAKPALFAIIENPAKTNGDEAVDGAYLSESGFSGLAGFSGFRFARLALFAINEIPAKTIADERLQPKDEMVES